MRPDLAAMSWPPMTAFLPITDGWSVVASLSRFVIARLSSSVQLLTQAMAFRACPSRTENSTAPINSALPLPSVPGLFVEEGLHLGVRLDQVEVRVLGREGRRFQEEQPLAEWRVRLVRTVEPQEVEGDKPELAVLFLLNANSVLRAGG